MQAKNIEASGLEYFDRQKAMYDRVRPELVKQYLGEFVAFEDWVVLDRELAISSDTIEKLAVESIE